MTVVILVEIHLELPFEITGKNRPTMAGKNIMQTALSALTSVNGN